MDKGAEIRRRGITMCKRVRLEILEKTCVWIHGPRGYPGSHDGFYNVTFSSVSGVRALLMVTMAA